ncbi:MAG: hypothetical protein U9O41_08805 [Candidatus Aerophobetes bacterium]|nr:hypothetical protein [Candidatus Aerophobetes bacterium]
MIYVSFFPFVWLAAIAAGVSLIWHYIFKVRLACGYWFTLIIAYLGAWLGTPVFGKWASFMTWTKGGTVSYLPAVMGALAAIYLARGIQICLKK